MDSVRIVIIIVLFIASLVVESIQLQLVLFIVYTSVGVREAGSHQILASLVVESIQLQQLYKPYT